MISATASGTFGECFLQHYARDNVGVFAEKLRIAFGALKDRLSNGELGGEASARLCQDLTLLRDSASSLLTLKLESDRILQELKKDMNKFQIRPEAEVRPNQDSEVTQADSASTRLFRRWFLENIFHPFPSTDVKHELVERTNAERKGDHADDHYDISTISYETCQLWFINARRRSQWTQFYRKYAGSQPGRMLALCEVLGSHDKSTRSEIEHQVGRLLISGSGSSVTAANFAAIAKECVDHFNQVVYWIERKPLQESDSWLDIVIQEGRDDYCTARRMARNHRRLLREAKQGETAPTLYLAEAWNRSSVGKRNSSDERNNERKSRHGKARKIASLGDSDAPTSPIVAQPSGSRSSRTFSGSSASSHGSMPSLIDAGSSSYDSCEGHVDACIEHGQSSSSC